MPYDNVRGLNLTDYPSANDAPGAPIEELMSRLIAAIAQERHFEMQIRECEALMGQARAEQLELRDQINKQLAGMGLTLVDGGYADE